MHNLRADEWGKNASIIILTNLDLNRWKAHRRGSDQPSYYLVKADNPPERVLEKVKEILDNT